MSTQITAGNYTLDPLRSTVAFQRKTFWGLATAKGVFGSVAGSGTVMTDGRAEGSLVIDVASLDSKNTKRDNHLRSKEMLNAESFPEITFYADPIPVELEVRRRSSPRTQARPTSRARLPSSGPAGS